jgi:hypothetical protein
VGLRPRSRAFLRPAFILLLSVMPLPTISVARNLSSSMGPLPHLRQFGSYAVFIARYARTPSEPAQGDPNATSHRPPCARSLRYQPTPPHAPPTPCPPSHPPTQWAGEGLPPARPCVRPTRSTDTTDLRPMMLFAAARLRLAAA